MVGFKVLQVLRGTYYLSSLSYPRANEIDNIKGYTPLSINAHIVRYGVGVNIVRFQVGI